MCTGYFGTSSFFTDLADPLANELIFFLRNWCMGEHRKKPRTLIRFEIGGFRTELEQNEVK